MPTEVLGVQVWVSECMNNCRGARMHIYMYIYVRVDQSLSDIFVGVV